MATGSGDRVGRGAMLTASRTVSAAKLALAYGVSFGVALGLMSFATGFISENRVAAAFSACAWGRVALAPGSLRRNGVYIGWTVAALVSLVTVVLFVILERSVPHVREVLGPWVALDVASVAVLTSLVAGIWICAVVRLVREQPVGWDAVVLASLAEAIRLAGFLDRYYGTFGHRF